MIDEKLLSNCKKMQRDAQRQLYELLSARLYFICKRYLKKEEEIEEVVADSFYTIFTKLHQLKDDKAFIAWAKRITVNQCLLQLKKSTNFNIYLEDSNLSLQPFEDAETKLEEEDLLKLLNYLPEGCRAVFNLFAIEGFSHKQIAKELQISEGTSKSQLNFAKTKLQKMVNNMYYQQAK
ncbi:MAG: RNA polymerase sigma factor (sigma-70 family) [Flavobacterium sp.]